MSQPQANLITQNIRWLWTGLAIFTLVVWCEIPAMAQYRFEHWTTDNGLPQNSVRSITQTRDGYLWFTTFDGLVRFDGVRFTVFDRSNTKTITGTRFTTVYEDVFGSLWAGTDEGELMRYRNGEFTAFTAEQGWLGSAVHKIQGNQNGDILVLTDLGYYFWQGDKFTRYLNADEHLKTAIYFAPSGATWMLNEQGLQRNRDGKTERYAVKINFAQNLIYDRCLIEDRLGALWVGTAQNGIYCVKDDSITHYPFPNYLFNPSPNAAQPATPNHVMSGCFDRDGNLWLGTVRGLIRFKNGQFTGYTTADGLSGDAIFQIIEDKEGTLWATTYDHGLNRLHKQFITTFSTLQGLPDKETYPILEDRTGNIWVGAHHLHKYQQGKFSGYVGEKFKQLLDPQSLCEDRNGRLWIGTYTGAVWMQGGKTEFFPLNQASVWAINEDRSGNLWFGTNKGLFRLRDGDLTLFTMQQGLPSDIVRAILETRDGNFWVGTSAGIAQFKDDRFVAFTPGDSQCCPRVRTLFEDADGALWIGTYDSGLSRFKDGKFTNYTVENGLYNNGAFCILEDRQQAFWISCNRGIYRVSKKQLNDFADDKISSITCTAYGKQDGMLNTECNGGRQPCGIQTQDGKFWFPTQEGVVVVNPDGVPYNPVPPPVLIESALVDHNTTIFGEGLQINAGQLHIEINYTALSFIKPEQIRFKYKLMGLDKDWVDVGTRRIAYYSYLPPGNYYFKVIAANSDGVWNEEGAILLIKVNPHFWQQRWFIGISLISLLGLAFMIFINRMRKFQRAKRARDIFTKRLLESQENERKRIAAELHDSLGQNLLIIKNRALMGLSETNDKDAIIEQLEQISDISSRSIEEVKEIAYNLRPYQIDRLGLKKALEAMVKNVSDASKISFTVNISALDGTFSKEAEINFYRIVQEGINNIVKHSGATNVLLDISQGHHSLRLILEDNGKGFTLVDQKFSENQGRGLGLTGLAERVRILGGKHFIQSAPGQGTKIVITFDYQEQPS
jgi:ligand-binding sensor domain-containing protein/signal transduction histidine kinase